MKNLVMYLKHVLNYILDIDRRCLILSGFLTFLTFLFFIFYQCQFQFQPLHLIATIQTSLNSTFQRSTKSSLTKMIVVSHYNEDLDWLDLFIGEQIPHIVYTRSSDSLARHTIPVNKGREAVVYLRYIVDYYSNLPSVIAFVHAHRTSWHQKDPSDVVVALRALQWNKYNYMPLTSAMTNSIFKLNTGDLQATVNYELWQAVLRKELGPPPPNGIQAPCCASFVVKREAILAHPKMFYSNISDYILASQYSDQKTGRTLEYTWHLIFGQPTHVSYRTCDLFVCDSSGRISVQLAEKSR